MGHVCRRLLRAVRVGRRNPLVAGGGTRDMGERRRPRRDGNVGGKDLPQFESPDQARWVLSALRPARRAEPPATGVFLYRRQTETPARLPHKRRDRDAPRTRNLSRLRVGRGCVLLLAAKPGRHEARQLPHLAVPRVGVSRLRGSSDGHVLGSDPSPLPATQGGTTATEYRNSQETACLVIAQGNAFGTRRGRPALALRRTAQPHRLGRIHPPPTPQRGRSCRGRGDHRAHVHDRGSGSSRRRHDRPARRPRIRRTPRGDRGGEPKRPHVSSSCAPDPAPRR